MSQTGTPGTNGGYQSVKIFNCFFARNKQIMIFLHYKWTFYFVFHHKRVVDTKLTPSRLQQTVVIKYERHAAYERINAKTGKHEKTVQDHILRITGCHFLAY